MWYNKSVERRERMSQLDNLMKLGLSEAEARQVLEDDKKIDRGEKMPFDLSKDAEKATRQYRQADRAKPFVPDLKPRERKPNEDKRFLINLLNSALVNSDDEGFGELPQIEITNAEREINFVFSGKKYKIVLSAPRT